MTSFTNKYKKHKPCGFCYHVVCFDDKLYSQEPVIYRAKSEDEDVAQIFLEVLEETSNALPIMRSTSASVNMSSLALSSAKKVKKLTLRTSFALSTTSISWLLPSIV